MKRPAQAEPFWMDEPNPYARATPPDTQQGRLVQWLVKLMMAYASCTVWLLIAGLVFAAIKYPVVWIFLSPGILLVAVQLVLPRFIETRQAKAMRIQRYATDLLGAELVGSAIHTAGNPALLVDQPVVLALRNQELSIYSYDSPTALDTLSVPDLQSVDLVSLDDDNTPHTGVINRFAQVLQITFRRQGVAYTCSFRRMYKVRPIEWYQALQIARQGGLV
jgi:hypothetical protein